MALTYEMKKYDESLSYANQILILSPGDPLAASYRKTITRRKAKQTEEEGIKQMIEKYK